jgi:hypothetical protein
METVSVVSSSVPAVTVAFATSAAVTASGGTDDLLVDSLTRLAIDVNVTVVSGTTPSCSFVVERKGADGVYYAIASPTALTASGFVSLSVGAGLSTNSSFGATVRLWWVISGITPSFTFSYSIVGK